MTPRDATPGRRVMVVSPREGVRAQMLSGSRQVAGEEVHAVSDLSQALALIPSFRPDLIVLDDDLSAGGRVEGVERLRSETDAAVILVAEDDEPDVLAAAALSGAAGVLPRSASGETVAGALRAVMAGGFYLDSDRALEIVIEMEAARATPLPEPESQLSPREREVLGLLAEGLSARQISRRLRLSQRTVNTHVGNLYRKLGVSNRVEAVRAAIRMGVVGGGR